MKLRLPFRSHRHPAAWRGREAPGTALGSLGGAAPGAPFSTARDSGSSWRAPSPIPEDSRGLQRIPAGCPSRTGGERSAELLEHQRFLSRRCSQSKAELPEGGVGGERRSCQRVQNTANQPGRGQGSNQRSPHAPWQRCERSSAPCQGMKETGMSVQEWQERCCSRSWGWDQNSQEFRAPGMPRAAQLGSVRSSAKGPGHSPGWAGGGDRDALAPPKTISTEVELSLIQGIPERADPGDPGGDIGDSVPLPPLSDPRP